MIAEREPAGTSLGVAALLRETRIKQGREIAVVATTLRIRQPYLQAIEDGRYQDLPGSAYAVGFVRGYAEFLGLDGPEIVRRFKQENNDLAGRNELVFPSATTGGGIPTGMLLSLAVVGAGVAYGAWYFLQDRNDSAAEAVPPLPERLAALIHKPVDNGTETPPPPTPAPQPEAPAPQQMTPPPAPTPEPAPPVAQVVQPAPPPAPVPAAAPPEPAKPVKPAKAKKTETPVPPPAPAAEGDNPAAGSSVVTADAPAAAPAEAGPPKPPKPTWKPSKHVLIRATADCWIKIRDASGQMVLSRLLHAGGSFAPPDLPGLVMTVGNAGALTLVVDGEERPSLGAEGMVKKIALPDSSAPAELPSHPND